MATPRLGLVCITASEEVRYRTVTRTRLLGQTSVARRRILRELWAHNIDMLQVALRYCDARRIALYRVTSALRPFCDHPQGIRLRAGFREQLRRVGELAVRLSVRLVVHPDQFVVLSSDSPAVALNSVRMLVSQGRTLDDLGLPRSPWAAIEIHGGKTGRGEALVRRIRRLPDEVRSRLVLENDEYSYRAAEILEICRRAAVPMVFDAHHHVVRERLRSYQHSSVEEFFRAARSTWPSPGQQIVHISSGRAAFADPCHADFISRMPACFREAPWIEVEAKAKELAIERLQRRGWGISPGATLFSRSGTSGGRDGKKKRAAGWRCFSSTLPARCIP